MAIEAKEIEFKYKADGISLQAFAAFCQERAPLKVVLASGYDHFYKKKNDPDSFCRHRTGPDANQLTFKRKTQDKNNYVRNEHNMDLTDKITESQVKALCSEFNYEYGGSLFKNCFVYIFDWYTLVYYVCYDKDLKEVGRFVEIEMSETHPWVNEKDAWDSLIAMERICKPLGITPQSRIRRSLFEMFVQGETT